MHPAADRYTRLLRAVETVGKLAQQGDIETIEHLLTQPTTTRLDASTANALRNARDSILVIRRALTALLEAAHEDGTTLNVIARPTGDDPTSLGHRSIDRAEAWRRAHRHLPSHGTTLLLLHIEEFQDGFRALPVQVDIPEPPSIPSLETPTTLAVDKTTGAVTRWPLLSLDVLSRQYRRYRQGEPMTLDATIV
ncbi:hypothetical protein GCM10009527_095540 [Actinomadura nitritigenes]|uniref:Uncharacterized protein n=1 Tax=Actinomadura nitritigenes TaxID=134602 RepID=A0ABS3R1X6_9ACTN|nr:hypothetical protein [Actinomadura nitritigenes]MBO2440260.1 hypothetical protein [Actinomadura nitritigenes]